jgi:hypothetical protein
MQRYRDTAAVLQRTLDLLAGIRKVRENIPRKETVEAVVSQRREFVGDILMPMTALTHHFHRFHVSAFRSIPVSKYSELDSHCRNSSPRHGLRYKF